MKILMIHKFYFPGGGSDIAMLQTKKLLEENGHTVIPFAMKHPRNFLTKFSKHFVSYMDFSGKTKGFRYKIKLFARMLYSLEARKKLRALIKEIKPNLAHLHNIYHQISPSILPELKRQSIPIVMTVHDYKLICPSMLFFRGDGVTGCDLCKGKYFYHAIKYRCIKHSLLASMSCAIEMYFHRFAKYYDLVDVIISPSIYYANKLIDYNLIPKNKITVLPNFVEKFDTVPLDSKAPMIFIGKLVSEKGISILLEAFAKLKNLSLLIVGDGPMKTDIEKFIHSHKLYNVTFKGFINNSEIKNILAKSSVLVLPSLHQESCPMTILEAYTAGRPVIVSRVGGNQEFVEDGVTGFLFNPGDVNDLIAKIDLIYKSEHLLVEMGKSARYSVDYKYSPEIYYKQLMNIYDSLLKDIFFARENFK